MTGFPADPSITGKAGGIRTNGVGMKVSLVKSKSEGDKNAQKPAIGEQLVVRP